jgi:hypothetical protein
VLYAFPRSRAFTRLRRASYFWQSPKSNQKAGAERGVLIRFLRIKIPCASRRGGVAQTVRPCTASQARRSIAAPLRADTASLAMLGTADGAVYPRSRPSMDYLTASFFALARTIRINGAPVVRRGCGGKAAGWRARCAPVRCVYMDVHSANPVVASRTRRAGARRAHHRGAFLLVTSLCARKEK